MEVGVHLPQLDFDGEGLSLRRLITTVATARECGFAAISVNDHFVYPRPWLDGPTLLAAAVEHAGDMALVTSISLASLRGPVPVAKILATLDALCPGRVIAGVGPGSSRADYETLGIPFDERWPRFDEAVALLRGLVRGAPMPERTTYYPLPASGLAPSPPSGAIPLWLGSWGSEVGLRRVARLGDGWLASAYNTDPASFAAALDRLGGELEKRHRSSTGFPHALATMWTWITESRAEAERVTTHVVAPMVKRDAESLRGRICVGSAKMCAELLGRYAEAGCRRVHFWPLGNEQRQLDLLATEVIPHVRA